MPLFQRNHILLEGRTASLAYTSTQRGSQIPIRSDLNRKNHGKEITKKFTDAVETFREQTQGDFVCIVFTSAWDFLLDLKTLNDSKSNIRVASYHKIEVEDADGEEHFYIEATVWLNKKAVSRFLRKLDDYIKKKTKKGNIPYQSLISNIEEIKAATLESFWQEPELPFPSLDEMLWWEVWLSRKESDNLEDIQNSLQEIFTNQEVQIGQRQLLFPENHIILVRATARTLSNTLLYADQLSELRKPHDLADFFMNLDRQEQAAWIDDLRNRINDIKVEHGISICLLDTGVNRSNPLLQDLIEDRHLDTVEPAWTTADSNLHGHGTPMAGLTFYGDLSEVLASNNIINVFHHLESIKLVESGQPHRPELYGHVTQEGVARGVVMHPKHKRIVCMAITTDDLDHKGRPSSWSSAVDQIVFNAINPTSSDTLFFVSSGNIPPDQIINAPLINDDYSIHDPAQSFNALTIGAYTLKDGLDLQQFPLAQLICPRGYISPCNSTSVSWEKEWCRKPDLVMEGGNAAIMNGGIFDHDTLQLLSTSKGGVGRSWFTQFGDTSAAVALASKFAAELWAYYPQFWPETVRGLMVHATDWTPPMLRGRNVNQLNTDQKKKLLSRVGYGVPNMGKAKFSANNSLTLIAQRELHPYKLEDNIIKTDQFHFFDLPWPKDVLEEMFDTPVKLNITLSYFIEPNPGAKQYEQAASYRSCGLRFKMIDRNERIDIFRARVSKAMRQMDYETEGHEDWILGGEVRNKGSIHKDIWMGPAIDLSRKNKIAVYPVNGWWRTGKKLNRYIDTIRYSLIVSIEGPDTNIDIYTPVVNQIQISI